MARTTLGSTLRAKRFLLNDCALPDVARLAALVEAVVIDTSGLTTTLERLYLDEFRVTNDTTLIVHPGRGAQFLAAFLEPCNRCSVYAKRWIPDDAVPVAQVGQIDSSVFIDSTIEAIIVVDDVIASGATLATLHRNNAWRYPRASWRAAAWVSNSLGQQRRKRLVGYESLTVVHELQHPTYPNVPINSVSTLVQQPSIAASYVQRYAARGDWEECHFLLNRNETALE